MRSRIPTRLVALVLVFILLPSVPLLALAQAQVPSVPAAQGPAPVDLAWPRQMETGGNAVLIYQPQPVKCGGNRLDARVAEGFSLHADVADSSVIAWRRKTTETVEIGGLPVPVGANLLLGSANRDPAVFETPERFDIHRLGKALALMHQQPDHPWTVAELAAQVRMSRTGFAVRFSKMAGVAPLDYLRKWRMEKASDFLRHGKRISMRLQSGSATSLAPYSARHPSGRWAFRRDCTARNRLALSILGSR